MKNSIVVLVCLVLGLGSACVPVSSGPDTLPVPPPRLYITGFSVLPLNDAGWVKLKHDDYSFSLAKMGKREDETYALSAFMVDLPPLGSDDEFISFVKKTTSRDKKNDRYLILSSNAGMHSGFDLDGVRFAYRILDRKALKRSGEKGPMILEIEGIIIRHPDNKLYGLHLILSHRCYEGSEDSSLPLEFESLLEEIQFLKL